MTKDWTRVLGLTLVTSDTSTTLSPSFFLRYETGVGNVVWCSGTRPLVQTPTILYRPGIATIFDTKEECREYNLYVVDKRLPDLRLRYKRRHPLRRVRTSVTERRWEGRVRLGWQRMVIVDTTTTRNFRQSVSGENGVLNESGTDSVRSSRSLKYRVLVGRCPTSHRNGGVLLRFRTTCVLGSPGVVLVHRERWGKGVRGWSRRTVTKVYLLNVSSESESQSETS